MKIKDLPGALTPESERGPDRAPPTRRRRAYFLVKRIQDILLSVFALAALAPVLLAIALAVVIDDPKGGPIFSQVRCGRRGKPFRLYKFRSMCVGAEKRLEELLPYNEMSGPAFKIQHDPRITRLGRFLRSTGLDELPQLVNILKGDMSIVGPRPPLPREVEEYTAHQRQRLTVTPGLTCFWQVSPNRNSLSFDTWVEMDLRYIWEQPRQPRRHGKALYGAPRPGPDLRGRRHPFSGGGGLLPAGGAGHRRPSGHAGGGRRRGGGPPGLSAAVPGQRPPPFQPGGAGSPPGPEKRRGADGSPGRRAGIWGAGRRLPADQAHVEKQEE